MRTIAAAAAAALLALGALLPRVVAAQQPVNPMHPPFAPLDADGGTAASPEAVSADRTCGACHDATGIHARSSHPAHRAPATCVHCHVDEGRLLAEPAWLDARGELRRDALRIGKPAAANCARCHGLVTGPREPVFFPGSFPSASADGRSWSLTLGQGAIVSPERMVDAFVNLSGKQSLSAPWDVHAAKLVDCVACHFAPNDPSRADAQPGGLAYVRVDPRRLGTAEFLLRPDHRLAKAPCESCHDARARHDFLPYKARHLTVLACAACHAPGPMGPAAELVDETVVLPGGGPAVVWRNVDHRAGDSLNTATLRPLRPLLVMRQDVTGARRLTPVNLVSRFRWVSGADAAPVPQDTVARAWREDGGVAPSVLRALDADGDGELDEAEQRLDTPEKSRAVGERLRALGVVAPSIRGELELHALAHGLAGRERAVRDCEECHAAGGRLDGTLSIAAYLPGGIPPQPPERGAGELAGTITPTPQGGLVFTRAPGVAAADLHVLGRSRNALTNTAGFVLFLAVSCALAVHAALRALLAYRRARSAPQQAQPPQQPQRVERRPVFGLYERVWHWTMAASGLALIATGMVIHSPDGGWPLGLATAVTVHNAAAVVLLVNAALALFYHVATLALRNFIPARDGLPRRVLEHLQYQTWDIFFGRPHPRDPLAPKLNPVQQLTYLALLNVLFPLQIGTGLWLWAVGHWPELGAGPGALSVVAPIHNLGAWCFFTFFVLHVYLVTTGRTLGEHLRAMVTGYRLEESSETPTQGG